MAAFVIKVKFHAILIKINLKLIKKFRNIGFEKFNNWLLKCTKNTKGVFFFVHFNGVQVLTSLKSYANLNLAEICETFFTNKNKEVKK